MTDKKSWHDLTVEKKVDFIREFDDETLAGNYELSEAEFGDVRKFLGNIPDDSEAETKRHVPPKRGILSARRDLSFKEANFELIDNSIDKWITQGKAKDLEIRISYDTNVLSGKFTDNAGGFAVDEVYKIFIPGETANEDYEQAVIGSFAMGAKKALFRLSSGIRVTSSQSADEDGAYCNVPEKWEFRPDWDTFEGRCPSIGEGVTDIVFGKLYDPPDESEIEDLKEAIALTYAPILSGSEYKVYNIVDSNDQESQGTSDVEDENETKSELEVISENHENEGTEEQGQSSESIQPRVRIWICEEEVNAAEEINLAAVPGALPRIYIFNNEFPNPILEDPVNEPKIKVNFKLYIGIKNNLSGDYGIDVFGNGRRFDEYLKKEFGFGKSGLALGGQGNKRIRGFLYISGHSVVIPWDTHKREYQPETEVARYLKNNVWRILKAFGGISSYLGEKGKSKLSKECLEEEDLPEDFTPEVFTDLKKRPDKSEVQKRWEEIKPDEDDEIDDENDDDEEQVKPGEDDEVDDENDDDEEQVKPGEDDEIDDENDEDGEEIENEELVTVQIDFEKIDADTLCSRLGIEHEDQLPESIKQSLLQGVHFPLDGETFQKACEKFDVAEDSSELSIAIHHSLMEALLGDVEKGK